MSIGITVSVLVLLAVASVPKMMSARDDRLLQRQPIAASGTPSFLYAKTTDWWEGRTIARVNVARLRGEARPPGVSELPNTGEAFVSPALKQLIESDETGVLGRRYGRSAGTIGEPGLASPDELIGYVGVDASTLRRNDGAFVAGDAFGPSEGGLAAISDERINPTSTTAAIGVLLVAMLVVFLSVCVRLSSVSQERRLSAMRLAGASANQARIVLAGELMLATVGGALLGLVAYLALAAMSEGWHVGSATWFAEDVRPGFASAVVLIGVPFLGHVVAQAGARRSIRDAFHVRRDTRQGVASTWRLVPGLVGLTALAVVVSDSLRPSGWGANEIQTVNLSAIVLCVVGFPLALPVVFRLLATALARSGYVPLHLAARRLGHEPSSATRVAVGAGVAVLIVGVVGSYVADIAAADTEFLSRRDLAARAGLVRVDAALSERHVNELGNVTGVDSAVGLELMRIVRQPPSPVEELAWVVDCDDAARLLGGKDANPDCPDGVVRVSLGEGVDTPEVFCRSDDTCVEVPPLQTGESVRLRPLGGGPMPERVDATVPERTTTIASAPLFLPELTTVALLVPPSETGRRGVEDPFETVLLATDGSDETEQAIRDHVVAADAVAEVTTQRAVFELRTQRRDFERA
ncbi:MAG TPA: hypothetical protein VEV43_02370, partial [Actinomycetota bacterium]|nr:hypothetical protein [Actinomycetota bacterium]